MDEDLKSLLVSVLRKDPEAVLDDEGRQAIVYAMLGAHDKEKLVALWRFIAAVKNEFVRSHLLDRLVVAVAKGPIDHDLAKQIANSIPDAYWRLSALSKVAEELLKRAEQFARVSSEPGRDFRERGLRLLREVEGGLSSIPEDDGDRATVLWSVGLSLVRAGELEWAESLASTAKYCAENTDVLLTSAKARMALGQTVRTLELTKAVAELASIGPGDSTNRVIDMENASELIFACGKKDEARKYLDEAAALALASYVGQDIEGWKCLASVAVALAKQGYVDEARLKANAISQPYGRDYALRKIAEVRVSS